MSGQDNNSIEESDDVKMDRIVKQCKKRKNAEVKKNPTKRSKKELRTVYLKKQEKWNPDELQLCIHDRNLSAETRLKCRSLMKVLRKHSHVPVKYFKNYLDYGRLYADQGMQGIDKRVRKKCCGEFYHDIDMKNAFPTFLLGILSKHNFDEPNITLMTDNRYSKKLKKLMKKK